MKHKKYHIVQIILKSDSNKQSSETDIIKMLQFLIECLVNVFFFNGQSAFPLVPTVFLF